MAFVVEIDFGFGDEAADFKSFVNKAGAVAHIRKAEDYRLAELYEVIETDDPSEAIALTRQGRSTLVRSFAPVASDQDIQRREFEEGRRLLRQPGLI